MAGGQRGPYLRAAAAFAKGWICLASGQGDAATHLQDALEGFARAQLPMELAGTRLELARALSEPMAEVAVAEAAAALEAVERLEAAGRPTPPAPCCGRSAARSAPTPRGSAR
jgi:hypothetical protein